MDSLNVQLYAFAATLLAGASTGFLFDLYRLLRSWLRPGTLSTAIMDLFFWLVLGPVIIIYMLIANWGELRLYVFIGVMLGIAFYYLIFSKWVIIVFIGLANFIGKTINFIFEVLFAVIMWPIRIIQSISLSFAAKKRGRDRLQFKPGLRWKSPSLIWFRRR